MRQLINDWILYLYNQYGSKKKVVDQINAFLMGDEASITRNFGFRDKITYYDVTEIIVTEGVENYVDKIVDKSNSPDGKQPSPRNILNSYIEHALLRYGNEAVVINQLSAFVRERDARYITPDYNFRELLDELLQSGKLEEVIGSSVDYVPMYVNKRIELIKRKLVDDYIGYASDKYSVGGEVIYQKINDALDMYYSGDVNAITRDKGFRGKFISYGITSEDLANFLGNKPYEYIRYIADYYQSFGKRKNEETKQIIESAFAFISDSNGNYIVECIDKGMAGDFSPFFPYSSGLNRMCDEYRNYIYDNSEVFKEITSPNKKGTVDFQELGFKSVNSITSKVGKGK